MIGERKLPVCWALLKGKQQSQYKYILQKIQEKISKNFGIFFPETLFSDFKRNFIAAVSNVLLYTIDYGCYFHYTQASYRKLQIMGFPQTHTKNPNFQNFAKKKFPPMGLVPPNLVVSCYHRLVGRQDLPVLVNYFLKIRNFSNYFKNFWIRKMKIGM